MSSSENFLKEDFDNELQLMRTLTNSTNDIFCIKDGEGRWLYANDEDLKIFQLEGVDYHGKKDSELAEYSSFYYDAFMACEETDEIAWNKATISRADEVIPIQGDGNRVFDVIKVPIFNKDKSRKNLVVIGRDITELARERDYSNSITKVLPDPFFILDSDGNFLDYQTNDRSLLAFNPSFFLGKNINDVFAEELADKHFKASDKVLKNGGIESFDYSIKIKGEDAYFRSQIVKFSEGKVLALVHDITQNIKSQRELEQFKETHTAILSNIKEAIIILDEQQKIIYVNKAATDIYGYQMEDFIGKSIDFISPKGMNDLNEISEIVSLTFNDEPQFFDFYGLSKEGRIFPKEVSSSLVKYYGQNAVVLVGRDVSVQKQNEEELKLARDKALESDRLKSSFLAILTHELRTPLNAVIGFSEIMHDEAVDDSTKYYSKIIYDKGVDLLNIINDTLQMALIDAGEVELRHESFFLSDFMSEVEIIVQTLDKKEGVELKMFSLENNYNIVSDKTKLNQILINLVRNAFKFTESGHVYYGLKLDENNDPYFFVEDTGSGISKEAIGFIFQAFRQVEESIARSHGGLGLGLTISKELVSLLGGELKVESKLGEGSVFYFQLPGVVIVD